MKTTFSESRCRKQEHREAQSRFHARQSVAARMATGMVGALLLGTGLVPAACSDSSADAAHDASTVQDADAAQDASTVQDASADGDSADAGQTGPALAFPGAEGFGAQTRGAYAKYESSNDPADLPKVLHVNTLSSHYVDDGNGYSGSFLWALREKYPRIIVFDTGGIINLGAFWRFRPDHSDSPPIYSYTGYLTIAGQTAPGDGICLTNGGISFGAGTRSPSGEYPNYDYHDLDVYDVEELIIRGLRFRSGNNPFQQGAGSLSIIGAYENPKHTMRNAIVDHCSFSWSTGKLLTLGYYNAQNLSATNNIFFEPLEYPSGDTNAAARSLLIGCGAKYVTAARNLYVHSKRRNPRMGGGGSAVGVIGLEPASYVEVINNLAYNTGWGSTEVAGSQNSDIEGFVAGPSLAVFINNEIYLGPDNNSPVTDASAGASALIFQTEDRGNGTWVNAGSKIFLSSNITPKRTSDSQPQSFVFCAVDPYPTGASALCNVGPSDPSMMTTSYPFAKPAAETTVLPLAIATDWMLSRGAYVGQKNIGAWPRDSVDLEAIDQYSHQTTEPGPPYRWIDDESKSTATLAHSLRIRTAPIDTDHDGMPDVWETAHGLDKNDPEDAHHVPAHQSYHNIEIYINSLL